MMYRAFGVILALHALAWTPFIIAWPQQHKPRFVDIWKPLMEAWDQPYNASEQSRKAALSKEMFVHAFNSYMSYGFPQDSVRPISCRPSNSQGGVGLTLLDSLDSLLLFGMEDDFRRGLRLIDEHVHFNSSTRVHVFELTIRALGGLLASHVAVQQNPTLVSSYDGVLLSKAQELAQQLLPAFNTTTGIPVSWVNLRHGRITGDVEETCIACAVTLAVELRLLSHLSGNPVYGQKADRAVQAIFARRDPTTHLVGNTLWTTTGEWERKDAGIGAGADSYYEYLLKTYLIFGDEGYLEMFVDQYASAQRHMAVQGTWHGFSWLLDVHMTKLSAIKGWVSSLSAFWPALQASIGQLTEAHMLFGDYIAAFSHFGWIPEQISVLLNQVHPSELAYPLRPEVVESAFALWAASGEPRYQRAGAGILDTISTYNSAPCGYCSVRNIATGAMEDGMESFFLAETLKYLFLLFSNGSAVLDHYVLSTEGHLLPVLPSLQTPPQPMHEIHTENSVLPYASAGVCPALWRQRECAAVCEDKPEHVLRSEADAAQLQFPALRFDIDSARLLRQRRCRVCRKVVDAFVVRPPAPPCLQAETMGVRLDRKCGDPAAPQHPRAHAGPVPPSSQAGSGTAEHRLADMLPLKEEIQFDVLIQVLRKAEAGEPVLDLRSRSSDSSASEEESSAPASGIVTTEQSTKGARFSKGAQAQQQQQAFCDPSASDSFAPSHAKLCTTESPPFYSPAQADSLDDTECSRPEYSDGSSETCVDLDLTGVEGEFKLLRMELLAGADTDPEGMLSNMISSMGGVGDSEGAEDSKIYIDAGDQAVQPESQHIEAVMQLSEAASALLSTLMHAEAESPGDGSRGGQHEGGSTSTGSVDDLTKFLSQLERQLAEATSGEPASGLQHIKVDAACTGAGLSTDGVEQYAATHQPQHTCSVDTSQAAEQPPLTVHPGGNRNRHGEHAREHVHEEGVASGEHRDAESHMHMHAHPDAGPPDESVEHDSFKQLGEQLQAKLVAYGVCFLRASASLGLRCSRAPILRAGPDISFDSLTELLPPNIAVAQIIGRPRNLHREQAAVAVHLAPCTGAGGAPPPCARAASLPQARHPHRSSRKVVLFSGAGASFGPPLLPLPAPESMPQRRSGSPDPCEACGGHLAPHELLQAVEGNDWLEQVNGVIQRCAAEEEALKAEPPHTQAPANSFVEPPSQRCICDGLPQLLSYTSGFASSSHTCADQADYDCGAEHAAESSEPLGADCADAASGSDTTHACGADHAPGRPLQGPLMMANPLDACEELQKHADDAYAGEGSARDYTGAVVLVARGSCMFQEKAMHVQRSGAVAMLVANGPQSHLREFEAHWGEQGGLGWGRSRTPGAQDPRPHELPLSPDVFLMSSDPEWDQAAVHIPAAMLTGPHGAALIATLTCMHGFHACADQQSHHTGASSTAGKADAPEGGVGGMGAGEPACGAPTAGQGGTARCAGALHASLFSGQSTSDTGAVTWDMEWRVLLSPAANAWVKEQSQEEDVSTAVVRDLLPAINQWVHANHQHLATFPAILPDDDLADDDKDSAEHPSDP